MRIDMTMASSLKTTAKSSTGKRLYLLNEKEFRIELLTRFSCLGIFVVFCATVCEEQMYEIYYQILNEGVLRLAHSYAWWSLLGLLSSSCCAIQLVLNGMSWGCAGFNTVLGPWRSLLLSITLTLQAVTWYIRMMVSPWQPKRISHNTSILSTILVLVLSLLPEALAFYGFFLNNNNNKRLTMKKPEQQTNKKLMRNHQQEMENNHATIEFKMENVGCSACLTTVARVMNGILSKEEDGYFTTSLPNSLLTVVLHNKNEKMMQQRIMEKLEEAGFPVETVVH